jgi:hypothetical protein
MHAVGCILVCGGKARLCKNRPWRAGIDKSAQYLGTIPVTRRPANIAFAESDKRTLYITAREGLYRVQTLHAARGTGHMTR